MTFTLCYLFYFPGIFFSVGLNIYDSRIKELKLFLYLTGICANSDKTIMYGMLNLWQKFIKFL